VRCIGGCVVTGDMSCEDCFEGSVCSLYMRKLGRLWRPESSESLGAVDIAVARPESSESFGAVDIAAARPGNSESFGAVDIAAARPKSSESFGAADIGMARPECSESFGARVRDDILSVAICYRDLEVRGVAARSTVAIFGNYGRR
jgi:hypothetical protein